LARSARARHPQRVAGPRPPLDREMTPEPVRRHGDGAELPIADFTGELISRVIGMEADSIAESALPESGWAHRHTFYEIAYITGGHGSHVIDTRAYPLLPATLYFLRPDQVHFWAYRSPPSGYVLAFSEDFLLSQPHRDDITRNAEMFNDLADAAQLCLSTAQSREILPIVKEIVREYHTAKEDYRSVMQAYLHVLLARAWRLLPPGRGAGAGLSRSALLARHFTHLVTHRDGPSQTVREYSDRLGVTPSHLAETVKVTTGRTPGQIIRGAQTVGAKRLLAHTDKNVAQIAYELGFKDTAYFGRFFKREVGLTPGEFRRQARASAAESAGGHGR
jgi:AraC family transcriptional activator of pobA